LRHDPFSMLPFCGYHMGDYFSHWLSLGQGRDKARLPKFYYVNWFQKGAQKEFLWPGFGENSRVLKWIFERCEGQAEGVKTPIGYLPTPSALDLSQLSIEPNVLHQLLNVDASEWMKEADDLEKYYTLFGNRLPEALQQALKDLQKGLQEKSEKL